MSRVLKRELAWLARDTPGFNAFQLTEAQLKSKAVEEKEAHQGPSRRIAHRGTEVFVAVGTEIRWSDITSMRDASESTSNGQPKTLGQVHRVLQTSVSRPIRQLSVSLSGDFLAIATDYTCHVAVLPSSAHLRSGEHGPIRVRSFQIGPTAHVVEKADLVSAIWHPLSPSGNCLITVTKDSCVRMWELDRDNRDSFGTPSLAVDLRKLSNASSQLDNFSTSTWGTNSGYSPDAEEMQVAGACFGGQGLDDEHGWSSMTLWIAMTEGGVYALCPFLPQRWRAPPTMLPSLTTSVVSKSRAISRAKDVPEGERRVSEQQRRWLADVDDQDPITLYGEDSPDFVEIYSRPERPGAIPKLQGPYYITPDSELGEITDIHVIAPKINDEELYDEDEIDGPDPEEALSVGVICLSSSLGKFHVCLDLNAVEAEWLPSRRPRGFTSDDSPTENDLLLLHTVNLDGSGGWPTLTPSPFDRYELFTTYPSGVHTLSFRPWISHLESELANPSDPGVGFRFDVLLENAPTAVTRAIKFQGGETEPTAVVAIADPTEGLVLMTCAGALPHSALLEPPAREDQFAPDEFVPAGALPAPELRTAYQPHDLFFRPSALPRLIRDASEKRVLGSDLKNQVRFSSATLQLMTDAHRILSQETHDLGEVASELFVRINRMREELHEQIRRVRECSQKVDDLMGDDETDGPGNGANVKSKIDSRIVLSKERTVALNDRVDALRKKMLRLGGAPLSTREKAFASEVEALNSSVDGSRHADTQSQSHEWEQEEAQGQAASLTRRLEAASSLREALLGQVNEAVQGLDKDEQSELRRSTLSGGHFRRQKIEEVWQMLEVETALVEAVQERLEKLS